MDQRFLFAAVGAVVGVLSGFGVGWLVRSPPAATAEPGEQPVISQPQGNLTKENAKKLIDADYAKEGPTSRCWIDNLRVKSDTVVALPGYEKMDAACISELETEGIIKTGECLDKTGSTECFSRVVKPGPKSKNDGVKTQAIAFECGSFDVLNVVSIQTDGNKAKVVFEREFKPTDRLSKLKSCQIGKPDLGRAKKEWKFERDDSGDWRIALER